MAVMAVMAVGSFSKDMRSLPQEGMKTMLNPRSDVSFLGLHVSSFRVETRYLREKGDDALVLAKIESAGSMDYLREILVAADGAMVRIEIQTRMDRVRFPCLAIGTWVRKGDCS